MDWTSHLLNHLHKSHHDDDHHHFITLICNDHVRTDEHHTVSIIFIKVIAITMIVDHHGRWWAFGPMATTGRLSSALSDQRWWSCTAAISLSQQAKEDFCGIFRKRGFFSVCESEIYLCTISASIGSSSPLSLLSTTFKLLQCPQYQLHF